MKKLFLLILSIVCINFFSQAQIDYDKEAMVGSSIVTKAGQVLVYGVDFNGTAYDFIVHVKSVDNGLVFDYEMTNANNTKGSVHISAKAMDDALSQNNYFTGGEMKLDDMTTVWVSRKVLMDIIEDGVTGISTDAGATQTKIQQKSVGHDYQAMNGVSGKMMNDLSYVYLESPDGSAKYWIHLNKGNPLILKMDLGWTIWLKEIKKA